MNTTSTERLYKRGRGTTVVSVVPTTITTHSSKKIGATETPTSHTVVSHDYDATGRLVQTERRVVLDFSNNKSSRTVTDFDLHPDPLLRLPVSVTTTQRTDYDGPLGSGTSQKTHERRFRYNTSSAFPK